MGNVNKPNGQRIAWPQAIVSMVAIGASAAVVILAPEAKDAALVVFGGAVTAGVGAFRGG